MVGRRSRSWLEIAHHAIVPKRPAESIPQLWSVLVLGLLTLEHAEAEVSWMFRWKALQEAAFPGGSWDDRDLQMLTDISVLRHIVTSKSPSKGMSRLTSGSEQIPKPRQRVGSTQSIGKSKFLKDTRCRHWLRSLQNSGCKSKYPRSNSYRRRTPLIFCCSRQEQMRLRWQGRGPSLNSVSN